MSQNYFNRSFKASVKLLNLKLYPSDFNFSQDTYWLNNKSSDIEPVIVFINEIGIGGIRIFLFKILLSSNVNALLVTGLGATKLNTPLLLFSTRKIIESIISS